MNPRRKRHKDLSQLTAIQSVRKALPPATVIYRDKRRKGRGRDKREAIQKDLDI